MVESHVGRRIRLPLPLLPARPRAGGPGISGARARGRRVGKETRARDLGPLILRRTRVFSLYTPFLRR